MKKLIEIPPSELMLGPNVRTDTRVDDQLVASIRERGVLEPIVAHVDPGGDIVVDLGSRRTLAAIAAGVDLVPVYLDSSPVGDEEDRIVDQLVENEHRAALTNTETAAAVNQLALLGVNAGDIAKRTATPRRAVDAAIAIAKSPTALQHADQVTLEQAAAIAEFDADPEASARLVEAIKNDWSLMHEIPRIRMDHRRRVALAAKAAELTETGETVIAKPGWDDKKAAALDQLDVTKRTHKKCPGRVVWVEPRFGKESDDDIPVEIVEGCRDWVKHGHTHRYRSTSSSTPAAEKSDEERAAAAAERRHVVESNKAWKACTQVRRRWLIGFAGAKSAPSGAEHLLARIMLDRTLAIYARPDEVLPNFSQTVTRQLPTATRGRALQLALLIAIASWESNTDDDTWRRSLRRKMDQAVLAALEEWGYELSPIERRVVAGTADKPEAAEAA